MDKDTGNDVGSPARQALQASRGETVAPLAALTGKPMALARRSLSPAGVSPLDPCNVPDPILPSAATLGSPDAPSAGEPEGAEPPSRAPSAAPLGLDKNGASRPESRLLADVAVGTERASQSAGDLDHVARPQQSSRLPFAARRLTLDQYRNGLAAALRRHALHHVVHGRRRRSFMKKARDLKECAQRVRFRRCGNCGAANAKSARVLSRCDLRSCPACARRRADEFRERLTTHWDRGERPRRMSLYLITFTLRYDPLSEDDLSIEGLKRRKRAVLDGVRYVWRRYLKPRGRAMAFAVEVSPRGAVHVHALYHGRRPDARELNQLYSFRTGGSFVHIDYVRRPHKSIREVAKYMVKAASPKSVRLLRGGVGEFIDPELAARAEVAFSGDRLVECLGCWRRACADVKEADEAPPPTPCPQCGSFLFTVEHAPIDHWLLTADDDWIPIFIRPGPERPRAQNTPATAS